MELQITEDEIIEIAKLCKCLKKHKVYGPYVHYDQLLVNIRDAVLD